MATPVVAKGGFIKAIISLVVVVAIVLVVVLVVADLTPNKLGLGNVAVNGSTINELGLGDTKVKDIFTAIKDLNKESADVEKEIVTEEVPKDAAAANDKLSQAGVELVKTEEETKPSVTDPNPTTQKITYSSLLTTPLYTETPQEISLESAEVGTIMNEIFSSFTTTPSANNVIGQNIFVSTKMPVRLASETFDTAAAIKTFKITIKQCVIEVIDGKNILHIIGTADLSSVVEEINAQIKTSAIKFPSSIVADLKLELAVKDEKIYVSAINSVMLNNSEAFTNLAFSLADKFIQLQEGVNLKQFISQYLGDTFCTVINNLGRVLSIDNGKIKIVTRTK